MIVIHFDERFLKTVSIKSVYFPHKIRCFHLLLHAVLYFDDVNVNHYVNVSVLIKFSQKTSVLP